MPSCTLAERHFEQWWIRDTSSIRLQAWQKRRLAILDSPQAWLLDVNRSIFSKSLRRE